MNKMQNYRKNLKNSVSMAALFAAYLLQTVPSQANPQDGKVVAGQAIISSPSPAELVIRQQTNRAIIEWKSFDIESGETTRFIQPSSSSVTLNRVTGSQHPSRILGTLQANGIIFIVNPDGILFGKNARIDVGGLLATTHDIRNEDFMAGRYDFSIPGRPSASIVNEGNISIADTGIGAFVAPAVRNSGVITARLGKIELAAANSFKLDMYGDNLINFEVRDALTGEIIDVATGKPVRDLVRNYGKISANGGTVALSAATARKVVNSVINNTGVIEANTVGMRKGRIVLGAATARTKAIGAPRQRVQVSGTLKANGTRENETGGFISVYSEELEFIFAHIQADGISGGGIIRLGGDYQGQGTLPTASYLYLDAGSRVSADAIDKGDGGRIIAWADIGTAIRGSITARGGAQGGNGGFVETSAKHYLDINMAQVNVSTAIGKPGEWLLDPGDVWIVSPSDANVTPTSLDPFVNLAPIGNITKISSSVIENALNRGNNVTIKSTLEGPNVDSLGDIYVKHDIIKSRGGDARLTLFAADVIQLDPGVKIVSTSGRLDIYFDADYDRHGYGGIYLLKDSLIKTNGGNIQLNGNDIRKFGIIDTSGFGVNGELLQAHLYTEFYIPTPLKPHQGYNLFLAIINQINTIQSILNIFNNDRKADYLIEAIEKYYVSGIDDSEFLDNQQLILIKDIINLYKEEFSKNLRHLLKDIKDNPNIGKGGYFSVKGIELPTYGNFGGMGYGGKVKFKDNKYENTTYHYRKIQAELDFIEKIKPVNSLDALFKDHDISYTKAKLSDKPLSIQIHADIELVQRIDRLLQDYQRGLINDLRPSDIAYATAAKLAFLTKIFIQDPKTYIKEVTAKKYKNLVTPLKESIEISIKAIRYASEKVKGF